MSRSTMNHDQIIEHATTLGLDVQHTQQGLAIDDMFDVTVAAGAVDDPLATARSMFNEPQRKHHPVPGQTVYGFEDDHAIVVLVDADADGQIDPWLHVMLYQDAETFERGWGTQAPA